jgi:hypothetical protein
MESPSKPLSEPWEGGFFGESQETCHVKNSNEAKVSGIGLSRKFTDFRT